MASQTTPHTVNDPIINEVRKIISSPAILQNAISSFTVTQNTATGGVDVAFHVSTTQGILSINLLRAVVRDSAQATVVQTWSSIEVLDYAFPDAANVASISQAFYWLRLNPVGTSGTSTLVGPQTISLNPDLTAPAQPTSISASHDSVVNGAVRVFVNVGGVDPQNSIRIFVAGYHGNPSPVSVAQGGSSPVSFNLDATGETVTITAQAVTPEGITSPISGSATLTLGTGRTVPAAPGTPIVVQFSGGNQVSWRSSGESWVISYFVYRSQRDETFLTATNIATVAATTEGTVNYVDAAGLTGDWAYYIVAHSASGDSLPSGPGSPTITYTSSTIPPNVPGNTTNNATIDSIDSGTNAICRIYGPGGPGTSYTHYTGYGSLSRVNGVINGLTYNTNYFIMYDTVAKTYSSYLQTTGYPGTLPDSFEYVGLFLTLTASGATGSGATASALVDLPSGHIIQVNPTTAGSGYISGSVTVSISGGGGSGAAATANVSGFGGNINSYTVTNGGTGYSNTPPVVVTVTGNPTTGAVGGGGTAATDSGYRGGCVEEGTIVDVPHGTISELADCEEWVEVRLGPSGDSVMMHPDTMVGVWKKAKELTAWSRINVQDEFGYSKWKRPDSIKHVVKKSKKVVRKCPGGVYRAGKEKILVHNVKYLDA